jgi:uncharacterized phiE125 gp8 family phage protein
MALKIITAPTVEPVNLAETKIHLRVDSSTEDNYINSLIKSAREAVENLTGRALITQTLEYLISNWPNHEIKLPRAPLQSVTSIKYTDSAGNEYILDVSKYVVNPDTEPGLIVPAIGYSWPSISLKPTGAITINYIAGYPPSNIELPDYQANVPAGLKHAILLLVGHWYEQRQPVNIGTSVTQIPFTVKWLCDSYRVHHWGFEA